MRLTRMTDSKASELSGAILLKFAWAELKNEISGMIPNVLTQYALWNNQYEQQRNTLSSFRIFSPKKHRPLVSGFTQSARRVRFSSSQLIPRSFSPLCDFEPPMSPSKKASTRAGDSNAYRFCHPTIRLSSISGSVFEFQTYTRFFFGIIFSRL